MNDSNQGKKRSIEKAIQNTKRGMFNACPRKVQRVVTNLGLSITEMHRKTGLSRNWLSHFVSGNEVLRSKVEEFCECLQIPIETISPDVPQDEVKPGWNLTPPDGWIIKEYIGPFRVAPNGLSYRVTRLEHAFIPEKQARGKFYDLIHVSPNKRDDFIAHLTRHPQVCAFVGRHPNISENIDVRPLPDKSGWWVIDPWIDGGPIEDVFLSECEKKDPNRLLRTVGEEILQALKVFHEKKIILRELSPDKVWLNSVTNHCVLTDFELAKLSEGAPSVSGTWQAGFFRAPEVNDYEAYPQSDLYSWGRMMMWILSDGKENRKILEQAQDLPKGILKLIQQCTLPLYLKRPASAATVLANWSKWK